VEGNDTPSAGGCGPGFSGATHLVARQQFSTFIAPFAYPSSYLLRTARLIVQGLAGSIAVLQSPMTIF